MKEADKICEEISSNPLKIFELQDWFSKKPYSPKYGRTISNLIL